MTSGPGVLYVVATPIGNLEDLTFRALRVLREVDLIAAEDTRRTARLLAHYEIRKPVVSLREHNERREAPRLIDRMASGQQVALVSDAGTPAIADPGARLVRAARDAGLRVIPIPGPSAVTAAISVAGLPNEQFTFAGFPPAGGTARRTWFERLAKEDRAVVFFEAPHRIRRTLADLRETLVNRQISVLREATKIHEQLVYLPNKAPAGFTEPERGEFSVVVHPPQDVKPQKSVDQPTMEAIGQLAESRLFGPAELETVVSALNGVPRSVAAKTIRKYNKLVKKQRYEAT
jgi:16S rRNA (cytidine1402-2'-O)-methyltransferase